MNDDDDNSCEDVRREFIELETVDQSQFSTTTTTHPHTTTTTLTLNVQQQLSSGLSDDESGLSQEGESGYLGLNLPSTSTQYSNIATTTSTTTTTTLEGGYDDIEEAGEIIRLLQQGDDDGSTSSSSSSIDDRGEGDTTTTPADVAMNTGDTTTKTDSSITNAYFKGELSFSEFSELMKKEENKNMMNLLDDSSSQHEDPNDDGQPKDLESYKIEVRMDPTAKSRFWKPQKSRLHHKIPKHLRGLMGEANLSFARGNHNEAIRMCKEIIRQAPRSPEPYQTLSVIYEDRGDDDHSVQCALIAAYLRPQDIEEWIRLANLSKQLGNPKQAITCYSNAMRKDNKNPELLWEKCKLYEEMGEKKRAMDGYRTLLLIIPQDNPDWYLDTARQTSQAFFEVDNTVVASDILLKAIEKYPHHIKSGDVNMSADLCITNKEYTKCLLLISKCCGVVIKIETEEQGESLSQITQLADRVITDQQDDDYKTKYKITYLPDSIPIDLRTKLGICLIYLNNLETAKGVLRELVDHSDSNEFGDLLLDIAEAYTATGHHKTTCNILCQLTQTTNYNLAAVWLRYADCLNIVGKHTLSAEAYNTVIEMAPTHLNARLALSAIQQQLGKPQQALDALSTEISHTEDTHRNEDGKLDEDLLLVYHRCMLLSAQNKHKEFSEEGLKMMSYYFKETYTLTCYNKLVKTMTTRKRREKLKQFNEREFDSDEETTNTSSVSNRKGIVDRRLKGSSVDEGVVKKEQWWQLYLLVCNALVCVQNYEELDHLAQASLTSLNFTNDTQKLNEINWIVLTACLLTHNYGMAYGYIRNIIVHSPDNSMAWNLFSQTIARSFDCRHNRFCLRMITKYPYNYPLGILNGHNALVSGTFMYALGEYVRAFRENPRDPIINLCIGLTYVHMVCQKFSTRRHFQIMQGYAFLMKYKELRGECMEVYYNLGRTMHQLGILQYAIYYYKKALEFSNCPVPGLLHIDDKVNLKRETAFNLSLIYIASGNKTLAHYYRIKYCII